MMPVTIALDLEGTIISDEVKRIPRPKLYPFLETVRSLGRVVVYTMVDPETAREILQELAKSAAPAWFADVEWVDWFSADTDFKDLNLILGSDADHAFLVDDHAGFVHPKQRHRWIQIPFFNRYNAEDDELMVVLWKLRRKMVKYHDADFSQRYPCCSEKKDSVINTLQNEIDGLMIENLELQDEKDRLTCILQEYEDVLDVMGSQLKEGDTGIEKQSTRWTKTWLKCGSKSNGSDSC